MLLQRKPQLLPRFPVPSLSYDFSQGIMPGEITYSRGSAGAYYDPLGVLKQAANNEPRFDHDPLTGEKRGLLIERARTNSMIRSEEFDNGWTLSGLLAFASGSVANDAAAPDGATTADKILENSSNSEHFIQRIPSISANAVYAWSVYVKPVGGRNRIALLLFENSAAANNILAIYDIVNGTVKVTTANGTGTIVSGACRVQKLRNGWVRLELGGQPTTNATSGVIARIAFIQNDADTYVNTYTGNGADGVHIFGAQLEAATNGYASSYIPTTGSTASRVVDNVRNTNLAPWFNFLEGTILTDHMPMTLGVSGNAPAIVYFDNDTLNELYAIRATSGGNIVGITVDGGSNVQAFQGGTVVPYVRSKAALSYRANTFHFAQDGAILDTDTAGTLPTPTQLVIGARGTGSGNVADAFEGWMRKLDYYPQRLSEAQLMRLTKL